MRGFYDFFVQFPFSLQKTLQNLNDENTKDLILIGQI